MVAIILRGAWSSQSFHTNPYRYVEMANKFVPVDIVRTRPCLDGKSPH